jgi:hypothetical protein
MLGVGGGIALIYGTAGQMWLIGGTTLIFGVVCLIITDKLLRECN